MTLIPKSLSAQTACSRELPQPKFSPVTMRNLEDVYGGILRMKEGLGSPEGV